MVKFYYTEDLEEIESLNQRLFQQLEALGRVRPGTERYAEIQESNGVYRIVIIDEAYELLSDLEKFKIFEEE